MLDFIKSYPFYIPFIIINVFIIYKVVKDVLNNDKGQNDEDDDEGGVSEIDNPVLDLPPGVTLPTSPKVLVLN
jgi:hypothetical protein